MATIRTGWVLLVTGALSGCAASVGTVGPQHVRPLDPAQVSGPYVPAGTTLHAKLDSPLDTQVSAPGQPFVLRVQQPVRDNRGQVLIPAGALVRGSVVSTGDPATPRLRFDVQSVDTVRGQAPLRAKVQFSEHSHYVGTPVARAVPVDPLYDPVYGGYGPSWGWRVRPVGGGPWAGYGWGYGYGYEVIAPRETHVPQGAEVDLQLTRDLIPPGTTVYGPRR